MKRKTPVLLQFNIAKLIQNIRTNETRVFI